MNYKHEPQMIKEQEISLMNKSEHEPLLLIEHGMALIDTSLMIF